MFQYEFFTRELTTVEVESFGVAEVSRDRSGYTERRVTAMASRSRSVISSSSFGFYDRAREAQTNDRKPGTYEHEQERPEPETVDP